MGIQETNRKKIVSKVTLSDIDCIDDLGTIILQDNGPNNYTICCTVCGRKLLTNILVLFEYEYVLLNSIYHILCWRPACKAKFLLTPILWSTK